MATTTRALGGASVAGGIIGITLLLSKRKGVGPSYPYGLPKTITAHFSSGASANASLIDAQKAAYLWKACQTGTLGAMYDFGYFPGPPSVLSLTDPSGKTITAYSSTYQFSTTTANNFLVQHLYVWLDTGHGYAYPANFPLDTSKFSWCPVQAPVPPNYLFWLALAGATVVTVVGAYYLGKK